MDHQEYTSAEFDKEHINSHFKNVLENYVCKIFVEAITSNHDLLWLITWSITWVGWQIHRLSIHGWFHKNKCDFGAYLKGIFYVICNCMYQGNGCKWVLDSETYSAIVCYQSTWYLYLYLYLIEKVLDAIQVLWVLVLELANFKSTCTWLKYFRKYLTPTLDLEHRLSALLQLHLHSRLNIWLQGIQQRQPQDSTRIF